MNATALETPQTVATIKNAIEEEVSMSTERPYTHARMLKVKVRSLMDEAHIIRRQEGKVRSSENWYFKQTGHKWADARRERRMLADHRRGTVRYAARLSQLAYAIVRGKTYAETECNGSRKELTGVDQEAIRRMVERYGVQQADGMTTEQFEQLIHQQALATKQFFEDAYEKLRR